MIIFPSPLPAIAVKTRAAIVVSAGQHKLMSSRRGEFVSWTVQDSRNRVIWYSGYILLKDVPPSISFPAFGSERYKVHFDYYNFVGSYTVYHDRRRYPFYPPPYKKRKKRRGPSSGSSLFLIKGSGSRDLRDAHFNSRIGARLRFKRNYRQRRGGLSSKPNPIVRTVAIPTWNYNNGVGTTGTDVRTSFFRSWSGTTTPGFGSRRKTHLRLPINDYSMTQETTTDGGYFIDTWSTRTAGTQTTGGSYQSQWGSSVFGSAPSSAVIDSSLTFKAIRKLRENMAPSANLAQDLAQMSQTTNMIADSATRIAAALRDTKKGNFTGAASHLWHSRTPRFNQKHGPPNHKNSLADNWLAFQYGWKPLLQDIHESMDSLARLNLASVLTYTARSSASSKFRTEKDLFNNVAGHPITGYQSEETECSVRYGVRYQIDNHLRAFLGQTGFTNPLNLAWEVLPYSFVADWFIPIGPYLESFSAWDGLTFVDGWTTTTTLKRTLYDAYYNGPLNPNDPPDGQMLGLGGSCLRERITYSRTRLTSFPSQVVPKFKSPISATHAANAAALLISAFRK